MTPSRALCWLIKLSRVGPALVIALVASACSGPTISSPFRASEQSEPSGSTDLNKLPDIGTKQTAEVGDGATAHCPQVVAWPQDRLLTVYQGGKTGDALSIIHRGEITKLARECQLFPDRVVVRYGVAGRVLLGPKGAPGVVTMPVNIHAAGVDHRVLAKDGMQVTATIPAGNTVGYFSVVKEISFPVVVGSRPEDYKVFVALGNAKAAG